MQKDPNIFLTHILESIEWINKGINGLSKDKFIIKEILRELSTDHINS